MRNRPLIIALAISLSVILTACVPYSPEFMNAYSTVGTGISLQPDDAADSVFADNNETPSATLEMQADEYWHENEEILPLESEDGEGFDEQSVPESEGWQTSESRTPSEPIEPDADDADIQPSSSPDAQDTTADSNDNVFYCPLIEAVPGHPGWYQSIYADAYILLFGQTDGLKNYIGKPVTILGTIVAENLYLDRLNKHMPVEVHGLREPSDFDDSLFIGEYVELTGMMELLESGNLILHSLERGDILLQTEIDGFCEYNYQNPVKFSGHLYPISGFDYPYILIVTGCGVIHDSACSFE